MSFPSGSPAWLTSSRVFLTFNLFVTVGLLASLLSSSPDGLLGVLQVQLSRNGEAFAFCLLISFEFQFFRTTNTARRLIWWSVLAGGFLVTEFAGNLPGPVVTLSESFLAALLISVFLIIFQPDRPQWPLRWVVPALSLGAALVGELPFPIFESVSPWIMMKAETWGFVVLTAILIGYLSSYPWAQVLSGPRSRMLWLGTIILLPLVVAAFNPNGVDSVAAIGPLESSMVWIQRITESFVAAVLLTVLCWLLALNRSTPKAEVPRTL